MHDLRDWVKPNKKIIASRYVKQSLSKIYIDNLIKLQKIVDDKGSIEKARTDERFISLKKQCRELLRQYEETVELEISIEHDAEESKFEKPDEIILDDFEKEQITKEKKKDIVLDAVVQTKLNRLI